jgi:hypothetical protein
MKREPAAKSERSERDAFARYCGVVFTQLRVAREA